MYDVSKRLALGKTARLRSRLAQTPEGHEANCILKAVRPPGQRPMLWGSSSVYKPVGLNMFVNIWVKEQERWPQSTWETRMLIVRSTVTTGY